MEFKELIKQYKHICYQNSYELGSCFKCPYYKADRNCQKFLIEAPEKAEKLTEKWVEEHKVKTNKDKFVEMFKVDKADIGICPFYDMGTCINDIRGCKQCQYYGFWQQEYKEDEDGIS